MTRVRDHLDDRIAAGLLGPGVVRVGPNQVEVRADLDVAALPRRAAHAAHALLARTRDLRMPATAAEVCEYDEEAPSVRSTGAALREARRRGLAVRVGNLWIATLLASEHQRELEDRFLDDTERDEDR